MRYTLVAVIAVCLFCCKSPDKAGNSVVVIWPVAMSAEKLPSSLPIKGKFHEAWQWTDKSGENILVTSYVEPYDDKEKNEFGEEGQTAELHAAQYVKKDTGYVLVWKNDGGVKACPFDITNEFIKDAITVTDLDKDSLLEVTVAYRTACRSDVSPSNMKLIIYEGTSKYSLNGYSWLRSSPEDSFTVTEKDVNLETLPNFKPDEDFMMLPGRYESEKGFASAPTEFLIYARQQWMKFVKERME
ncbi:MAG: hypothetical protein HOP10_00115 [Chitinophagaceae bacterium]|nr:hypothetical protein [Chitinophagaceae bacterium]